MNQMRHTDCSANTFAGRSATKTGRGSSESRPRAQPGLSVVIRRCVPFRFGLRRDIAALNWYLSQISATDIRHVVAIDGMSGLGAKILDH